MKAVHRGCWGRKLVNKISEPGWRICSEYVVSTQEELSRKIPKSCSEKQNTCSDLNVHRCEPAEELVLVCVFNQFSFLVGERLLGTFRLFLQS